MVQTLGCVVMAAGNARRFGENKLAAGVGGRSLILRALDAGIPPDPAVSQGGDLLRLGAPELHQGLDAFPLQKRLIADQDLVLLEVPEEELTDVDTPEALKGLNP